MFTEAFAILWSELVELLKKGEAKFCDNIGNKTKNDSFTLILIIAVLWLSRILYCISEILITENMAEKSIRKNVFMTTKATNYCATLLIGQNENCIFFLNWYATGSWKSKHLLLRLTLKFSKLKNLLFKIQIDAKLCLSLASDSLKRVYSNGN